MTATPSTYPTAQELYKKISNYIAANDVIPSDWEEFIYEVLCEDCPGIDWEESDNEWRNDEEFTDQMTKEIMELFGV